MPDIEAPQDEVPVPVQETQSVTVIAECPECGEEVLETEASQGHCGNIYHEDCLDEATDICTYCDRRWDNDLLVDVQGGRVVCPECRHNYRSCGQCDELVLRRRMHNVLSEDDQLQVCPTCLDECCYRCNDCNNYVHEDGHDCNGGGLRNCNQEEGGPMVSPRSSRFETRLVGIEFETALAKSSLFDKMRQCDLLAGWTWHHDGSLQGGGMEIVSNPIGGGFIEDKVRAYYKLCEETGSLIQGNEAGGHVHVNAKDIFESIYDDKDYFTTDLMDTAFRTWGQAMLPIVRLLVSTSRRNNGYCMGGFAGRDCVNWKMQGKTKLGTASYPTIAIRENTIEFRIWPSTNNVESMLARIELSQKAVDIMHRCVTRSSIKEHRAAIKAFVNTCNELTDYLEMPNLSATPSITKDLKKQNSYQGTLDEANRSFRAFCRMLGMSRQGSNQLAKLFNRFAFNNNTILITKTKSTLDGAE